MFRSLKQRWPRDTDLPARSFELQMRDRVIEGTLYDVLPHEFHTEKAPNDEYVPLRDRRPSVRYRLCRLVVDDAASLLFSEGHFPGLELDGVEESTHKAFKALAKELKLNEIFIDAVTKGSIGSVCLLLRVLRNRAFVSVMKTVHLMPTWDPQAPDQLLKVVERYKLKGQELKDAGYAIADGDAALEFWWQREWTPAEEVWYLPLKVSKDPDKQQPQRDSAKTVTHNLGFVPMVWVRNLPGGDETDGAPTFPDEAVDTNIEMDYQLSQAGRGLKYSSDPTLLVKEPALAEKGSFVKGAANAIVVGPDGDAKMLEINGTAVAAVIEYVRLLRELAIESMHGNRANTEKQAAAPSGKALELMNQALVWLADRLRISYGEGALRDVLVMLLRAHAKVPLQMKDGTKLPEIPASAKLTLRWPAWYQPTLDDLQKRAATLVQLCDAGLLSRETAIKIMAAEYDIEDPAAEKALADAQLAQRNAEAQKVEQIKVSE
jgi:hypothetical protein